MKSSNLKRKLSFLHNKKIAVIGNASSLFDHKYGTAIDTHDYIVRLNFGCIKQPECQGSRTDIVGFSVPLTNKWVQAHYGTPRLIWMSPKNRDDRDFFSAFDNTVYFYPIKLWEKLTVALDKNRPSTGIMMLDLISRFKPAQINLFGFDFKKTKTYYLKEDHAGPHNWALEQTYTEKLVKSVNGNIYE
jgi:hypothetical protein